MMIEKVSSFGGHLISRGPASAEGPSRLRRAYVRLEVRFSCRKATAMATEGVPDVEGEKGTSATEVGGSVDAASTGEVGVPAAGSQEAQGGGGAVAEETGASSAGQTAQGSSGGEGAAGDGDAKEGGSGDACAAAGQKRARSDEGGGAEEAGGGDSAEAKKAKAAEGAGGEGGGGGGGGSGGGEGDKGNSQVEIMHLPSDVVGLVIGKKGGTIRELEMRSGCKIKVDSEVLDPRPVTLEGTEEVRHYAKSLIYDMLDSNGRTGIRPQGFQAPAKIPASVASKVSEETIEVPDENVGLIIGRAGATIREFEQRTGCRIGIAKECPPGSKLRPITIAGPVSMVQACKALVVAKATGQPPPATSIGMAPPPGIMMGGRMGGMGGPGMMGMMGRSPMGMVPQTGMMMGMAGIGGRGGGALPDQPGMGMGMGMGMGQPMRGVGGVGGVPPPVSAAPAIPRRGVPAPMSHAPPVPTPNSAPAPPPTPPPQQGYGQQQQQQHAATMYPPQHAAPQPAIGGAGSVGAGGAWGAEQSLAADQERYRQQMQQQQQQSSMYGYQSQQQQPQAQQQGYAQPQQAAPQTAAPAASNYAKEWEDYYAQQGLAAGGQQQQVLPSMPHTPPSRSQYMPPMLARPAPR